jgi:hypothetical protein
MATWDEQVDAAIDDAARRMTEGAPAADFTARVVERIAEERRGRAWGKAWLLSPLAAAAVLLIAVFLLRGGSEKGQGAQAGRGSGNVTVRDGRNARAAAADGRGGKANAEAGAKEPGLRSDAAQRPTARNRSDLTVARATPPNDGRPGALVPPDVA